MILLIISILKLIILLIYIITDNLVSNFINLIEPSDIKYNNYKLHSVLI